MWHDPREMTDQAARQVDAARAESGEVSANLPGAGVTSWEREGEREGAGLHHYFQTSTVRFWGRGR